MPSSNFILLSSIAGLSVCRAALTTFPLIPQHVQRQRRLLESNNIEDVIDEGERRRQEAVQVGALYNGYGTHYMDLWCGTPPQRQTVIVDTGSGVTAFPCSGCNDCGAPKYHIDNYFEEAKSSTFEALSCGDCHRGHCTNGKPDGECVISMSYQEGSSWHAFEAIDNCYVGGPHNVPLVSDLEGEDINPDHASHFAFPMAFGCQTRLTGLFKTQLADGIMGMENAQSSFWYQMFEAGKMGDERKFSLCFSRPEESAREGTEAGAMSLGGADKRLHKTEMVYTTNSMVESDSFGVHVRKIHLREGKGGESAKSKDKNAKVEVLSLSESLVGKGGVIVDSGTTDTYWVKGIATEFRAAFKKLTGMDYSHTALSLSDDELAALPTILFQLQGDEERNKAISNNPNSVVGLAGDLDKDHPYDVILAFPPSHYMERSNGKYTARFYEASESVIGANAIMGHDVLFDIDNQILGWAESDCDYGKLVTSGGYIDVLKETADQVGKSVAKSETVAAEKIEQVSKQEEDEDILTSPADKKKEPGNDVDAHDQQFPADDIKKQIQGFADACDSSTCRGGVLVRLWMTLLLFYCCKKCRCCASKKPPRAGYKRTEVEMSNGDFSSYRDEDGYTDGEDTEHGKYSQ